MFAFWHHMLENDHIWGYYYVADPPCFGSSSLAVLTFWLCKRSLLCAPVSCLIIEACVSLGSPSTPLIKACVCVCLFISRCYSRSSPTAPKRHKSQVPTEASTISCRCACSDADKNECLSLEKNLKNTPKHPFSFYSVNIFQYFFHYQCHFSLVFGETLSRAAEGQLSSFGPFVSFTPTS